MIGRRPRPFQSVRRAAAAFALATAAASCSGPSRAPLAAPARKTDAERLDRYHQRAKVVVGELAELGFKVNPAEVTILLGEDEQDRRILINSLVEGGTRSADGLGAFRRMLGLQQGLRDRDLLVQAAISELRSLPLYYDPEGQYLVFRDAWIGQFSDVDLLVAHGLAHAYQDQEQGGIEAFFAIHSRTLDRSRAAHAVLEGQANLIAAALSFKRRGRSLAELDLSLEDDSLDHPLVSEGSGLLANSGQRFLLAQYQRGGWPAVRDAYRFVPASSEQLLHPDKYPSDTPRVVTLPAWPDLAARVKHTASDVLGEMMLFATLAESLTTQDDALQRGRDAAELAAIGWDGDRIDVYELPDRQHAALFRSVWDLDDAAREFSRVLSRALELKEVDPAMVSVEQRANVVDVAFSEDPAELPALRLALQKHPRAFTPQPEDQASTLSARAALRARSALRPHLDAGHWVHPASGIRIPVPDGDWELALAGGSQVLIHGTGADAAVMFARRLQDLWSGDFQAFLRYAEVSLFTNPHFEQVELERRSLAGTKVGVFTLRMGSLTPAARFRFWIIPREGHFFLLAAGFPEDEWEDAENILADMERRMRIEQVR